MRSTAALCFLLVIALAAPAAARPRVDTIVLTNGDRVTGEIVRLEAATLTIRTSLLGTVDVDWPDIAALVSPQLFEVERADGVRFVGSLAASEAGAVLAIAGDEPAPTEIELRQVVGLEQRGSNLWTSRRGYVDLGWNFTQANSNTSFSLGAELALHGRWFRWVNAISATLSDDENSDQTQREVVQSRLEVPAGRHFLYLGQALHERNDDLGLDARDSVGGIFAWLPVNGARGRLVIGPGAVESREKYAARAEINSVTAGAFLVRGEFHTFGRFGTRAELSVIWFPVLSGPDRDRVEIGASLRQKFGSEFTVTFSPYYSYDSRPPDAEAASEDWGWVTSVGLTF
jgi:hypothetical protein